MTTAWSYLVRGQIRAAAQANAGGALLGLAAMTAIPWAIVSAARGHVLGGQMMSRVVVVVAAVILTTALLPWLWRLATLKEIAE